MISTSSRGVSRPALQLNADSMSVGRSGKHALGRLLHVAAREGSERQTESTSHVGATLPTKSNIREQVRSRIRNRDHLQSPPASPFLTDKHQRRHSYLRISLTERCNLRCLYCMPEEGVPLTPKESLLSSSEVSRLARLFVSQGVDKIRLTGGEPTLRKDLPDIIGQLSDLRPLGLRQIGMTTNGLTLSRHLSNLVFNGLTHLNISLDTLDPLKFELITRRPFTGLEKVLRSVDTALAMGVPNVKINVVVIKGLNDTQDVVNFVKWASHRKVTVRFIEYMPFDGNRWKPEKLVPFQKLLETISNKFGPLERLQDDANDTSKHWRVPGHEGKLGFITSMTDHFCGTCNRLRITADGNLKVCLFGNSEVSLRDAMRHGLADQGSFPANDEELLEIIGAAVGRKHAKHAGMADLNALAQGSKTLTILTRQRSQQSGLAPLFGPITLTSHLSNRSLLRLYSTKRKVRKSDEILPGDEANSDIEHQSWSKYMGTDADGDDSPWASLDAIADGAKHLAKAFPDAPKHLEESWENSAIAAADAYASSLAPSLQSFPPPTQSDGSSRHPRLTHLDQDNQRAFMVDVSSKNTTIRVAQAQGRVYINETALRLLQNDSKESSKVTEGGAKGPVLQVAQLAGIMGAKKTSELIPLCHGLHLSHVDVKLEVFEGTDGPARLRSDTSTDGSFTFEQLDEWSNSGEISNQESNQHYIQVTCTAKTSSQTGVEMEALTGVSIACLTIWDMLKSVAGKEMRIDGLMVTGKQGGKSGDWTRA